jgi:AcrR family transcriptional regulator
MSEDAHRRYFDAAHEILGSEGYGALKLAQVCKRVGVTTGAFYHNFSSWGEFTDALLEDWLRERTDVTARLARDLTDPVNQLEMLLQASVELRHDSEAAIRVWAGTDPRVAEIQMAVDEGRYGVVYDVMLKLVGAEKAPAFAWWGCNVLAGFEMISYRQTPEDLRWQLRQVLDAAIAESGRDQRAKRASA